jgi:hypothetical protein
MKTNLKNKLKGIYAGTNSDIYSSWIRRIFNTMGDSKKKLRNLTRFSKVYKKLNIVCTLLAYLHV